MKASIRYEFTANPWKYESPGGWYFISVPEEISAEIREHLKWQEEGWGRLKAEVKIGVTIWKTAIWFDTKRNTHLLPLKAEIRKKENLEPGKSYAVSLWV